MPHKLFEGEVSKTLQALGTRCFYLKPLDGVMWTAERVDFHCVIDGRGVNIEAKETVSDNGFSLSTRNISPNQLNCLQATELAGGIGLLLVNFGRKRQVGRPHRGIMAVYRSRDLYGPDNGTFENFFKLRERIVPEGAYAIEKPVGGGTWSVDFLDRVLWDRPTRGTIRTINEERAREGLPPEKEGGHIIGR